METKKSFIYTDKGKKVPAILYHEIGHAIQAKTNLFNINNTQDPTRFLKKGLKYQGNSELVDEFKKSSAYSAYLCEAHSESFAAACMIMRSQGKRETAESFIEICANTIRRTLLAARDKDKNYPSMKYYASMPHKKQL